MTERQKRFCDEYLKDQNATQAALRAGYAERTAEKASDWINEKGQEKPSSKYNAEMREYIDQYFNQMHNENVADAQELLEYLTSVVRGTAKEQALRMVHGTQEIVEVDVPNKDKMKAVELLGKANGMFANNLNVNMSLPVFYDGESDLDD